MSFHHLAQWAVALAAIFAPETPASAAPSPQEDTRQFCGGSDADRAIAACSAIIRGHRSNSASLALVYYDRGITYRLKRRFDRARSDLDQSIRLQPDFAAAYLERGIVWYETRAFARAIADDDSAIRLQPDLAEAFNNRALARLKLAQFDQATADFNQTIRLHQFYGNALINRSLGPLVPQGR